MMPFVFKSKPRLATLQLYIAIEIFLETNDTTRGASYYYSIAMTQGSLIAIRDKLAIVGEQRGRALNSIDKRGASRPPTDRAWNSLPASISFEKEKTHILINYLEDLSTV